MKKGNLKVIKLTYRKIKNYLYIFFLSSLVFILAIIWISRKLAQTQAEVDALKLKAAPQAKSIDAETVTELSERASKFASYLPDEFNIYQVIGLIEQISRKTKFDIQTYELKYVEGSLNNLQSQSLTLQGSGTLDQFMAFLKEYKFITGKMLTIDAVNLSGKKRLLTNLTVNIYAFKPEIVIEGETIPPLTILNRKIIKKIDASYIPQSDTLPDSSYKSRDNPFME